MVEEYDPAHKTTSIASTTSTNSNNSNWDYPLATYQLPNAADGKDMLTNFEEYPQFDDSLVSERISIPPFEYFEEDGKSYYLNLLQTKNDKNKDELQDDSINQNNIITASHNITNIKKENHKQENQIVIANSNISFDYHNMTHHNNGQSSSAIMPIYLQQSNQMTMAQQSIDNGTFKAFIIPHHQEEQQDINSYISLPKLVSPLNTTENSQDNKKRTNEEDLVTPTHTNKKIKTSNADNSTDDIKRANHIISEQKRRNTIRIGFKELTDMIPTLKNINNSKSTILFKAVEFIKHLDKKNRSLREKVQQLQIKLEIQNKIKKQQDNNMSTKKYNRLLPPDTVSALIAHKNQQKQLEQLQNQLRYQHQLLKKHNITVPSAMSSDEPKTYNSIFIPTSSKSSICDENDIQS